RNLLQSLEAPPHLLRHVELVGEAGDELLETFRQLAVPVDANFVRIGIILHDAGKLEHPHEMYGGGNEHEPAGEKLLLAKGVDPRLARVCQSHARWAKMECSFEELAIALADTLWKGVRREALEQAVVQQAAQATGKEFWDIFVPLDSAFEKIAEAGHERL